jgi:hypothetical protein
MTDLERVLDQIRRRDWTFVRSSWLNHLAVIEDDSTDEVGLKDVTLLEPIASDLLFRRREIEAQLRRSVEEHKGKILVARKKGKAPDLGKEREDLARFENNKTRELFGKFTPRYEEISGVREALFVESTRLAHKALHVLGSAELDATIGMRSWSLCSAYQASLFASKALLGLCGIGIVEINNKTLFVDVFPEPVINAADYVQSKYSFGGIRLDHKAVWQVFQRTIAVTACAIWPAEAVDKLRSVEERYFARQRNDLQYRNTHWPLGDLYDFLTTGPFGEIDHAETGSGDLDFDREDISLVVCFYIIRMTLMLFRDLGTLSNKLTSEIERFQRCLVAQRHPMYHEMLFV